MVFFLSMIKKERENPEGFHWSSCLKSPWGFWIDHHPSFKWKLNESFVRYTHTQRGIRNFVRIESDQSNLSASSRMYVLAHFFSLYSNETPTLFLVNLKVHQFSWSFNGICFFSKSCLNNISLFVCLLFLREGKGGRGEGELDFGSLANSKHPNPIHNFLFWAPKNLSFYFWRNLLSCI